MGSRSDANRSAMIAGAMPTAEKGTLIGTILELGAKRRTGELTVRAEEVTTVVFFDGGVPIDASEAGTSGEPLGRLLVRTHVITAEQHAKIIDAMASSLADGNQQRFGEIAVSLGILSRDKVDQALKDQIRWRIVRALQRENADWTFSENAGTAARAERHELALDSILLDAVRWFPDERRRTSVEGRGPFYVATRGEPNAIARRFGMTPEEQTALEAFDGTATVDDLVSVETSSIGADVSALLVALVLSNLVELSDAPRAIAWPSAFPRASIAQPGTLRAALAPKSDDRVALTVARLKKAQARLPAHPPEGRRPQNEREARVFAEQSFQHGLAHLRANRTAQAVPLFRRAFGLMPKNLEFELYAMWAEVRVHAAKPTAPQLAALRNIAVAAIRQDPNFAFAYHVLGHVTLHEGSEVMAKRHFAQSLRLDPDAIDAERHLRVIKRREARASRIPQVRPSRPPPRPLPSVTSLPALPPVPKDRPSALALARVSLKKASVDASTGAMVPTPSPSGTLAAVLDELKPAGDSVAMYDKVQKTLELPAHIATPLPGALRAIPSAAPSSTTANEAPASSPSPSHGTPSSTRLHSAPALPSPAFPSSGTPSSTRLEAAPALLSGGFPSFGTPSSTRLQAVAPALPSAAKPGPLSPSDPFPKSESPETSPLAPSAAAADGKASLERPATPAAVSLSLAADDSSDGRVSEPGALGDVSPLPEGPSSLTAVSSVPPGRLSPTPSASDFPKPPVSKRGGRGGLYAGAVMLLGVLVVAFAMFGLRMRGSPATATPSTPPLPSAVSTETSSSLASKGNPASKPVPSDVAGEAIGAPPSQASRAFTPSPSATASPVAPSPSSAAPQSSQPKSVSPDIEANEGVVLMPKWATQRRVYVDGKLFGNGPARLTLPCGTREIKIGSSGKPRSLDVPCGNTVDW